MQRHRVTRRVLSIDVCRARDDRLADDWLGGRCLLGVLCDKEITFVKTFSGMALSLRFREYTRNLRVDHHSVERGMRFVPILDFLLQVYYYQ